MPSPVLTLHLPVKEGVIKAIGSTARYLWPRHVTAVNGDEMTFHLPEEDPEAIALQAYEMAETVTILSKCLIGGRISAIHLDPENPDAVILETAAFRKHGATKIRMRSVRLETGYSVLTAMPLPPDVPVDATQ